MPAAYNIENIESFVGSEIGVSDWFTVDQNSIDAFGRATHDPDPQHNDPEWAALHSPFGTTIAYGFQTLSMLSHLTRAHGLQPEGIGFALNYGLDRVRFIAPVPVNSRIRCRARLMEASRKADGVYILRTENSIEIEGAQTPAMVAEWLGLCAAEGVDPASL